MDGNTLLLIILFVPVITLLGVIVYLLTRKKDSPDGSETLDTRLQDLRKTVDTRLHQNTESMHKRMHEQAESMQKRMHEQFESSKKLIADITKELTEVKATGREMLSFTEQLQSLERTLKNPQRRGAVGEYVLEQVIANVLPPGSYDTQHTFSNNVRADAVVFLQDDKMICIDAKFSLDNYTKLLSGEEENPKQVEKTLKDDLKKRVQETAKYILPKENTLDFAFMFVPSESLYYDLLTQKIGGGTATEENLLEYAFNQHRVIIVSPTTLLAYLQTVHLGLRAFRIEKQAEEIKKHIERLKKHLDTHTNAFHGVGRALGTAVNQYNKAEQQYDMIDKDVYRITGTGGEYGKELLDRPHGEEKE